MQRRRIVFTGPFDPRLCSGVSGSTFDLLNFLNSKGHETIIISFMHNNDWIRQFLNSDFNHPRIKIQSRGENSWNFMMDGIKIYYEMSALNRDEALSGNPIALGHYLRKIKEYSDSFFFTVDKDQTCLVAHSILGTQTAHFIHSPISVSDWLCHNTIFRSMLRKKTVFIVNKFAQEELSRKDNIKAHLWPPFIDSTRFKFPRSNRRERKIGYYSAGPHKGDLIVDALVEEMPDCHFMIMGNNYNTIRNSPNVTFLGNATDLFSFYGDISLLLVPSIIAEGYPRVIIEAAFNGIPTLANRIGGVTEALGDSGIMIKIEMPEKMVENYKMVINELLNDPNKYEEYCGKATKRAEKYKLELERISTDYDNEFF